MKVPTVSVVVVNHNGRRFLERLFSSLAAQTYPALEVLCVDSGSSDDSVSFLRERFPTIRVLTTDNRGFGSACNRGAHAAEGEYLCFLNEDMWLPADTIARLRKAYETIQREIPDLGALGCSHGTYAGELRNLVIPGVLDLFGFVRPNSAGAYVGAFIPGCPFFIPRPLFLESGGFCENIFLYGDDLDLSWRLVLFGRRNASAPEIVLPHYEGGALEGFPPKKIAALLESQLVVLLNNLSLPVLLPFLSLHFAFSLLVLHPALLVLSRGKIGYNVAAARAVLRVFRKLPSLLPFRRFVQRRRVIGDLAFLRRYGTLRPAFLTSRAPRRLRAYARQPVPAA